MYRDFIKEEFRALAGLIATAEYKALKGDTGYYRAAWLERRLKPEGSLHLDLLLQASWEADGLPELKARYQREFSVAAAAAAVAAAEEQGEEAPDE